MALYLHLSYLLQRELFALTPLGTSPVTPYRSLNQPRGADLLAPSLVLRYYGNGRWLQSRPTAPNTLRESRK